MKGNKKGRGKCGWEGSLQEWKEEWLCSKNSFCWTECSTLNVEQILVSSKHCGHRRVHKG